MRHYEQADPLLLERLDAVRADLRRALAEAATDADGTVLLTVVCAGEGRDLLPVLAECADDRPVRATLIELDPVLADRARATAAELGLDSVEVRTPERRRPTGTCRRPTS